MGVLRRFGWLLVAAMWLAGCNSSLTNCIDDANCPAAQWCDPTIRLCVSYARGDGGVDGGPQTQDAGATDAGLADAGVADGGIADGGGNAPDGGLLDGGDGGVVSRLEANVGAGSMFAPGGRAVVRGRLGASGAPVGSAHSIKGGFTP